MNTHVKPGMLARVVRAGANVVTPGIVDRIVEVVRPAHNGELFKSIDGVLVRNELGDQRPCWVVKSKSPLPCMCGSDDDGPIYLFHERPILDSNLRPLGGVPIDEETREELTA